VRLGPPEQCLLAGPVDMQVYGSYMYITAYKIPNFYKIPFGKKTSNNPKEVG